MLQARILTRHPPAEEVVVVQVFVVCFHLDLVVHVTIQNQLSPSKNKQRAEVILNVTQAAKSSQRWSPAGNTSHLIHLVPGRVQVFLDYVTLEHSATYVDLDVRVTLALHHAPHQVILGHQVLSFQ